MITEKMFAIREIEIWRLIHDTFGKNPKFDEVKSFEFRLVSRSKRMAIEKVFLGHGLSAMEIGKLKTTRNECVFMPIEDKEIK